MACAAAFTAIGLNATVQGAAIDVAGFGYINAMHFVGGKHANNPFYLHPNCTNPTALLTDAGPTSSDITTADRTFFSNHAFVILGNGQILDLTSNVANPPILSANGAVHAVLVSDRSTQPEKLDPNGVPFDPADLKLIQYEILP